MPALSSVSPSPKSNAFDLTYIPTILKATTYQTQIHSESSLTLKYVLLAKLGMGYYFGLRDNSLNQGTSCALLFSSQRYGRVSSIGGSCLGSPGLTSGLRQNRC